MIETPILIVGGASVGLSLAAELGWRGQQCLLVEKRTEVNPHPRANAVGNRTMEYFRRWGVDEKLYGKGVPPDYPADYYWVSSLHGRQLYHLSMLSYDALVEARKQGAADPSHEMHWSPYLKTIVGQQHVERALKEYVQTRPTVNTRFGWELVDFEQDEEGVNARIVQAGSGQLETVRCQYLVACDGGSSTVRTALDIDMTGRSNMARFISIYFRCPDMMQAHPFGHGNIYFPLRKEYRGFLLNWDGGTLWTYHLILPEGTDWRSINPEKAIHDLVGTPVDVSVIEVQPWTAHALTATHYRTRDVFLAGDAAHKFTPTGGLGMNTGVGDAIELAWKLEAVLQGWAPDTLLDTYHTERQPVGVRNTLEAADNFDQMYSVMQHGPELDADTDAGKALRASLSAELAKQEKILASSGVLLGYRYNDSPIIVPDNSPEPPDDPRRYVPTARPGHRAPHIWLSPDQSILDTFGPHFTLLDFDGQSDTDSWMKAAEALKTPLKHVKIDHEGAHKLYDASLVLVRPDMMVAWRGSKGDALGILKTVTGQNTG